MRSANPTITATALAALLAFSPLMPAQTSSQTPASSAPSQTPASQTPAQTPTSSTPNPSTQAPASAGGTMQTAPADKPSAEKSPAGTPGPAPEAGVPTPEDREKARQEVAKNADKIPQVGEDLDPNIKKGSEDDVSAIGTRNIGGRGLGNWYSVNWEVGTGKQYSMEIEKSAHLITDPVIAEYVNRIGQNIVKNSDCKVPFTIRVIDSDEINAMALPGGFFYVNSGLILNADEEAELAGVMAHETAHVCAHHAARQMTMMNYMQIGQIPLIIFTQGSWTGYGIYEASQLAVPMAFLKFSRSDEAEADYLGVQYMYRAGYDPQAFVQFFEKISALEKHKPGILSTAFRDHPQTPDRIARSEEEIATILPAKNDYIVSTSEFDDIKARLARLENKRKVDSKGNGNKPTLRRTAGTNNDPNKDDRPTLSKPQTGQNLIGQNAPARN